jgi:putative membrane protein insertion efficiency factor
MGSTSKIWRGIAVAAIKFYQYILSPMLSIFSINTIGGGCRFYPSCSEYSKQAVKYHGVSLVSLKLIIFRLIRCQPFVFKNKNNGYDPIINKIDQYKK